MKSLSFEQIRALTKGALTVSQTECGVTFDRYTPAQKDFYAATETDFFNKAHASAGVCLDMTTDAWCFQVDFTVNPKSQSRFFCYFDLYVNDKPFLHHGWDNTQGTAQTLQADLPIGKKRLTLWLPTVFETRIGDLRINDEANVEAVEADRTLLCIGDSITHGYDAMYPSCTYPALIGRYAGWNVINQGIAGDRFHPGNLGQGIGFAPDAITLLLGTNDWANRSREQFLQNTQEYFALLGQLYPHTPITVITPLWRGDWERTTAVGSFDFARARVRDMAQTLPNATVLEGWELMPHKKSLFSPDALHPNDLGFQTLFGALLPHLKGLFRQ